MVGEVGSSEVLDSCTSKRSGVVGEARFTSWKPSKVSFAMIKKSSYEDLKIKNNCWTVTHPQITYK